MSSLYQIEQDLLNAFDLIENNDGELTPELEELLSIKEEEFANKIGNYVKAVLSWSSSSKEVKDETTRLNNRRKVIDARVERLKNVMLRSVMMFGSDGKSGNKTFESDTFKLFTRDSKEVIIDPNRVKLFLDIYTDIVGEVHSCETIYPEDVDLKGVIESVNANYKALYDLGDVEEYIPFTISDLKSMVVDITTTTSVEGLLYRPEILQSYRKNLAISTINMITTKSNMKTHIEGCDLDEGEVTIAGIRLNTSLTIK